MELSFKIQQFEGPLDLLLHLIEKNKVDILDIPIAQITDQYFAYIEEMRRADMDVMSEFLVMAATLLDIKSRMLLPPEKDEEGEEIDPRSELVQKLLEYKIFKQMSYELRNREDGAGKKLFRHESIPAPVRSYREPVDLDVLLADVTLMRLHAVFRDVMKRQEDRIDPQHSNFGRIEKEEIDSRSVMLDVEKKIMSGKKCTFRSLLTRKKGRVYTVVTFLTILELLRMGRIGVEQEDSFGEIYITVRDRREWNSDYTDVTLDEIEGI